MKKLINGIIDFQKKKDSNFSQLFSQLALGQSPDALFLTCSDSRVAVNVFASTDPGDLFVIRNVGNIFPPAEVSEENPSSLAVLEYAVHELKVKHIIVCGHSECGGMKALLEGREKLPYNGIKKWLSNSDGSLLKLNAWKEKSSHLEEHNCLSQANVIQQMENLASHDFVKSRLEKSQIKIHGLWFDIKNAQVEYYFPKTDSFEVISEETRSQILSLMGE